ncbi:MAG: transglycosylase SLT domain-containing protein [Saprospiraceae bacterium]|nr:transglycosylase SLT domain-containing protein [Saprospiraceae bacterium]MDW8482978.1 transglycosylase SLT domain-containing protein [Saprospiraceae bacterium]
MLYRLVTIMRVQQVIFLSSLRLLLGVLCVLSGPAWAQHQDDADLLEVDDSTTILSPQQSVNAYPLPTDAELRQRLGKLRGCIDLRVTPAVHAYVRTYLQLRPEKTRQILGRRLTYFPLFEEKLKEHGLPADLKYLAVVESALNPRAVSRAGAVGLWQFMPTTGQTYSLRQNGVVDERANAIKSTEAAARYLKDLFRRYNDWALALAAYNSGPGRVNAAIKRAHSRNFWVIQRYLPRETRNYVPAFIAATYLCNFFYAHGVVPLEPDPDEQLTAYLKIHEAITFQDILEATGIEYNTLIELNAGFKRFYIPQDDEEGHYVLLPARVMPAFLRYLNGLGGRKYSLESLRAIATPNIGDGRYWQLTLTFPQAEPIERVATMLGCHPEHLKAWNHLTDDVIAAGQRIVVWKPVYVFKHTPLRMEAPQNANHAGETTSSYSPSSANAAARREEMNKPVRYLYHIIQRDECLEDIARQYNTSLETLRRLNNCENFCPGTRLKVKEL